MPIRSEVCNRRPLPRDETSAPHYPGFPSTVRDKSMAIAPRLLVASWGSTTHAGAHRMRKLVILAGLLVASNAFAADSKSALKGSGAYGTAGCGLGSMAFG